MRGILTVGVAVLCVAGMAGAEVIADFEYPGALEAWAIDYGAGATVEVSPAGGTGNGSVLHMAAGANQFPNATLDIVVAEADQSLNFLASAEWTDVSWFMPASVTVVGIAGDALGWTDQVVVADTEEQSYSLLLGGAGLYQIIVAVDAGYAEPQATSEAWFDDFVVTPEPASMLILLAGAPLLRRRR